ncbi:TIGR04086 family membrane protein [Clostridium sp. D2Q-14]|uniref:TIGR04086 family membrane protein n=1 Tax=Anaeromonas gelatinilytica TaxID=2683194 RepID=UPI00193C5DE9|nr:TIGR04086 family membrane protein [Anaeromonas gelatinilytica]MBS4534241.1 TIGR04086 family membrane protein [Anaeromonas gelatinilytica]
MNNSKANSNYSMILVKSLILSFIITFIFFVIFTLILTYTNLSESWMPIINSIILIISISIGAIKIAINTNERGYLNGGIIGLIYVIILILLSAIFMKEFQFSSYTLIKIIIGVVAGVLSGMIGANLK